MKYFKCRKASSLDTTEEDYYKIIGQKTSSLFVAAVESAVFTMNPGKDVVERMGRYAYHRVWLFRLRMIFLTMHLRWIREKPAGGDIKERKLTLPLIAALKRAGSSEREEMLKAVRMPLLRIIHLL
ncbi:hypothetical protein MASR1M46_12850 [Bacteroidales bacterium]